MTARPGVSAAQLLAAHDAALASLGASWPGRADLERAHAAAALQRVSRFELYQDRALALLEAEDLGGAARFVWTFAGRTAAVTPERMRAVMDRILNPRARTVMLVQPGPAAPEPEPVAVPAVPPAVVPRRAPTSIPTPTRSGTRLTSATVSGPAAQGFVLSNGLPVILSPTHEIPRVDGTLVVRAGDAASGPGELGLAQAAAELLVRGTESHDEAAFAAEEAAAGAWIRAGTDWTTATVSFEVTTPYLAPALALWSEVVRQPAYAAGEVERWKRLRATFRDRIGRDQLAAATEALARRMFAASSPYAWPGAGTMQSTSRITPTALRQFHLDHYHPANAALVVVGDVEARTLRPLLERALGGWQPRPAPPPPPPPPTMEPGPPIVLVDVPGRRQAVVTIATRALTGWPVQRAMTTLMADLLDTALTRKLEADGLAYPLDVTVLQSSAQVIQARARVPVDQLARAIREMRAEIDRLRTDRRAWAAVSVYRGNAIQRIYRRLETIDGLESALLRAVMAGEPPPEFSVEAVEYESIPTGDLLAYTAATLAPDRLVTIVAGDRRTAEPQVAPLGAIHLATVAP